MCLAAKASELFLWSVFTFLFFFLPSCFGGRCGMDVTRWSTEKAIYPPFVLLHSFKKANSLKANRGGTHLIFSSTSSGSSWLKLHVYILSRSLKWEAFKTCIQYSNEFSQEDERSGECAIQGMLGPAVRKKRKRGHGEVGIWLRAGESYVDRHWRASYSQQSAAVNG